MEINQIDIAKQWFVMRDLKRTNALLPAYKQLSEAGIEVFTPMTVCIFVKNGKRIRKEVPVMHDLLFVHDCRQNLDPIVAKIPTLQYRFKKGGKQGEPVVVSDEEMLRFITAVKSTDAPKFFPSDFNSLSTALDKFDAFDFISGLGSLLVSRVISNPI
jgi:hypothetical protein